MDDLLYQLEELKLECKKLSSLISEGKIEEVSGRISLLLEKERAISQIVAAEKQSDKYDQQRVADLFDQINTLLIKVRDDLKKWSEECFNRWQELRKTIDILNSYQQQKKTSYYIDNKG